MSVASNETSPVSRRLLVLLPLAVFLALAALFLFRLGAGDPSKLPSVLIGRAGASSRIVCAGECNGCCTADPWQSEVHGRST